MTLKDLIQFAWGPVGIGTGLHSNQVVGGPRWMVTGKFDLSAKSDALGRLSREDRKQMVKALLGDRFQLGHSQGNAAFASLFVRCRKGWPQDEGEDSRRSRCALPYGRRSSAHPCQRRFDRTVCGPASGDHPPDGTQNAKICPSSIEQVSKDDTTSI